MSDDIEALTEQETNFEKIRQYNAGIVNSVLVGGIKGGADVRGAAGSITSVSSVMANEISAVVIPTEGDIKNAQQGLVSIGDITSGWLRPENPTLAGVLEDTILSGNAAGLLPVSTERPWEYYDQTRFHHSQEIWEERLGANIIILVPLNHTMHDRDLMRMNYFEGRFKPPFRPEDFNQIFVPEEHIELFQGVDPRIITTILTEEQQLNMYVCDNPNEGKHLERRAYKAPNYIPAIYKYISQNGGRYAMHIVRLACPSDLDHLNNQPATVAPSKDQLDNVGKRRINDLNRKELYVKKEPEVDPLDETDPLRIEVKRIIEDSKNQNPMPKVSRDDILDSLDGNNPEVKRLLNQRVQRIESAISRRILDKIPALFPQLGLQLTNKHTGLNFNELSVYGINGTIPIDSHIYTVFNNLEIYIRKRVEDVLGNTEYRYSFNDLAEVEDFYEEIGVTSMISTLKFLARALGVSYSYQIGETEKLMQKKSIELILSDFKGIYVSEGRFNIAKQKSPLEVSALSAIYYYYEMTPNQAREYCTRILEKLKLVFGEESEIYTHNLGLYKKNIEIVLDKATAENYTGLIGTFRGKSQTT